MSDPAGDDRDALADVPDGAWFWVGARGPFRITFGGDPMRRDCFRIESHDGADGPLDEYVLSDATLICDICGDSIADAAEGGPVYHGGCLAAPVASEHPMTGNNIRAAISAASPLINPRVSEIEWDDVAITLSRPAPEPDPDDFSVGRALFIDTDGLFSRFRQQIAHGKLKARKVGRDWHVTPAEVKRYGQEHKHASSEEAGDE